MKILHYKSYENYYCVLVTLIHKRGFLQKKKILMLKVIGFPATFLSIHIDQ